MNQLNIENAVVYNISIKKLANSEIAIIYYLCIDDEDNPIVLSRSIPIESEYYKSTIELLPYTESDDDFIYRKIFNKLISTHLKKYITDMNFHFDDDKNIYIFAMDPDTKETIKMNMKADVFMGIAFLDNYISDGIDSEHDLSLSTIISSKKSETTPKIVIVDDIVKIESLYGIGKKNRMMLDFLPINKHENTSIALSILFVADGIEQCLLTTLDTGELYNKNKFKDNTIDIMINKYYSESKNYKKEHGISNRYIGVLTVSECNISDSGTYMVIRAKNIDGEVSLFLFSQDILNKLSDMIKKY